MKNNFMVTVCIATYNGEKYISEQLNSILPQLSLSDEIIISDDHSTDKTLEIIKSFEDNRVKIFMNENKKGYSKNFGNNSKKIEIELKEYFKEHLQKSGKLQKNATPMAEFILVGKIDVSVSQESTTINAQ